MFNRPVSRAALAAAAALCLSARLFAQQAVERPDLSLGSDKPAAKWDEALPLQAEGEGAGGPHRTDGVRTGRTDTDLEQVERADGHPTP